MLGCAPSTNQEIRTGCPAPGSRIAGTPRPQRVRTPQVRRQRTIGPWNFLRRGRESFPAAARCMTPATTTRTHFLSISLGSRGRREGRRGRPVRHSRATLLKRTMIVFPPRVKKPRFRNAIVYFSSVTSRNVSR